MRRGLGIYGPLPAEQVWERYAVPAAWPSWSPQIRSVEASTPRLRTGTTGVVHGPLGVRVRFEVLSVDESLRRWVWRAHAGPISLRLAHEVFEHEGGSDTTLEMVGPAPVVLAYYPLAKVALHNLVHP